jgi:sterol desaturase/sphingolipid hydroxylase (fatty acid hydroxylase superfamily)
MRADDRAQGDEPVIRQAVSIVAVISTLGLMMMLIERLLPGRHFPRVDGWLARAISINGCQVLAILFAGIGWNSWMAQSHPWSVDRWGTLVGAIAGYVALTLVYYWWHLWRHRSDFLWRWLHQIHHSPQRLELLTAFYKHPLEIVIDSLLSSAVLYLVIGLGPQAAAGAMALSGIVELFYHWNVKTPYWLGFIVQRPESHLIHHQEGLHDYNYSDLPIWDILFGTLRNPEQWNERCGFEPHQEQRVMDMLRGIDLSKPSPRRDGSVQSETLAVSFPTA